MLKKIVLKTIRIYQKTLSFDHGFFSLLRGSKKLGCRFFPSCSEFMYQAVEKYGVPRGFLMGISRVLRCHPFSRGGFDPIK